MTEHLSLHQISEVLKGTDDILVLTHKNPDGDAIGSALAVTAALRSMGKRCNATWTGQLIPAYDILIKDYEPMDFEPRFILAVDLATPALLPEDTAIYKDRIDMSIDHHRSNTGYASMTYVQGDAASCCQIIAELIDELGVEFTDHMGNCVYVGLATDTGCFKYSNTDAAAHLMAARLASMGIDITGLNTEFFEQRSRARIELERLVLAGMEFTCGGKICIITVTRDMLQQAGCLQSDVEDIAGLPRSIRGVQAGITLREQPNGNFKVSVRTKDIDASKICSVFGGGGHIRAAGCECSGTAYDIKVALVSVIKRYL